MQITTHVNLQQSHAVTINRVITAEPKILLGEPIPHIAPVVGSIGITTLTEIEKYTHVLQGVVKQVQDVVVRAKRSFTSIGKIQQVSHQIDVPTGLLKLTISVNETP